jgi:protein tyrosine/serine phosphatase
MPGRTADYLDMIFVDHGIFRLAYLNKHRLDEKTWRSAQPAPHNIRAFARQGVRTLVNLRGERQCGSYRLEREACRRYGITMVNFHIRSRRAPTLEDVKASIALFDSVTYPMLMHCKSGADRTGLMSTYYCHLKQGMPVAAAITQLSPLYGHFRWSRAGISDAFFDRYLADNRKTAMPFMQWLVQVYDPVELLRTFEASRRINWPGFGDD